jgi:hypothetical protein
MNFCAKCHRIKKTTRHQVIPKHLHTINLCKDCKTAILALYPAKKMPRQFYLEVVSAFLLGRDPVVRIDEARKKSR